MTPSRRAAATALHAVFGDARRVPEAWDRGLAPEDAALARAMLGLSIRHWGRLQAWFESRLRDARRGAPLGSRVAAALGAVQLAWLPGVSGHAAVNEAVELAGDRELGFPPHRGLVNAVLRAATKDRGALAAELAALPGDLDQPPFARRAMEAALAPRAQSEALPQLWERLQTEPPPVFRRLRDTPLPEGLVPDPACPGALLLAPGAPFPRPWLVSGDGMVQDRSSQALMAFAWDGRPARILDACAAPGGKTTALTQRFPDAQVTALEQDARRTERLRQNLEARGVRAHVITTEASRWLETTELDFDLILLDAPCSASGTLRKHPELAWIGDAIDLGRLATVQARLLEAASARLAPGGLLVYAVCSWFPEEGLAHRDILLKAHSELAPVAVWPSAFGRGEAASSVFLPDPLAWEGEGFQGFALQKKA